MNEYLITYAQNREDVILSGFFDMRKKGFYVDVGAHHPERDSVTKLFYDQGWTGINLEPNPSLYKLFEDARPNDINLNIGVSNKPGILTLREYINGEGLSTFSDSMKKTYLKNNSSTTREYMDHQVETVPLKDVFGQYEVKQINFMKIDVEGLEYEVISGNDWVKYRPQVLCIEANHIIKDWRPLIEKAKYDLTFFDGLNNYYVARECSNISKRFSYIQAVLPKTPIPIDIYNEIESIKSHNKSLKQTILSLEKQYLDKEQTILSLQKEQRDIRLLAKNLYYEIQLRINKRVNRNDNENRLRYVHSEELANKVNNLTDDKKQLLSYIHKQDLKNIKRGHQVKLTSAVKKFGWKVIAKLFNIGSLILIKVSRRVS